jgi:hypothetical protein
MGGGEGEGDGEGAEEASTGGSKNKAAGVEPTTGEQNRYLGHDNGTLVEGVADGGVPKDGIPSIDEPTFAGVGEDGYSLDPGDPVFGVVRDGVAKAYPQYVLVHHEIVNDTLAGDPVVVSYCPLTGTAQGFERGDTEFGVSGKLVNSNLIMYDRGTDSWWPQIAATAIKGPMTGAGLQEFRVVWTTWERWREQYPETAVLTEDTGYSRRYGTDPYGSYNTKRGYYKSDRTLFDPIVSDARASPKDVVIGTRTGDGAIAFDKELLRSERVLTATLDGTEFVAVAEPSLATGYVYRNRTGKSVEPDGDGYRVDGGRYDAASLPLERSLAFDSMWFPWAGFYPETEYVG